MSNIHATAIIGKDVEIGVGNEIGPHVTIEPGVKIGSHNRIRQGVFIASGTEINNHNDLHMHAVIGHIPQDLQFEGEPTYTKIGSHNQIREFASIHRGTKPGSATVIGDHNYIMAYCHIAHNCVLGSKIIMVNQASLTGYCEVEDDVLLSGMTGFHQFTRIGRLALVSALSAVNKDVPPYMICGGRPGVIVGMNVVGLRRAGMNQTVRNEIKEAYKLLYRSGLNVSQALAAIKKGLRSEEAGYLVRFIEASKRGICDSGRETEESLKPRKKSPKIPSPF